MNATIPTPYDRMIDLREESIPSRRHSQVVHGFGEGLKIVYRDMEDGSQIYYVTIGDPDGFPHRYYGDSGAWFYYIDDEEPAVAVPEPFASHLTALRELWSAIQGDMYDEEVGSLADHPSDREG